MVLTVSNIDYFKVFGIASAARGRPIPVVTACLIVIYVSKLHFGQNVSSGRFTFCGELTQA